jgi:cytoskeletal protein RodZ
MITVGEILATARIRKRLTLEQVEKATRIRSKFLEAIEKDQFDKLPPGTFAKGFIKNYATFLGISPDEAMAFYRRQSSEKPVDVVPMKNQRNLARRFSLTPQLLTTISIAFLVLCFFGYLIFAYFRYAGAPILEVSNPSNNTIVKTEQVTILGKTNADAALTINDQSVTVSDDGSFKISLKLQPGINTITITSTNKFQRQTTVVRNLRLEK